MPINGALLDELRRTLVTVRNTPDAHNAQIMAITLAQRAIDALSTATPDLAKLGNDTNKVLEDLYEMRNAVEGAINWADLSCRQTASGVMDDGVPFLAVWIEEAAPDNYEFQRTIMERLKLLGHENVQVVTEW